MQKVTIKKDGKDTTIEMQALKGKHCRKGWEMLAEMQKASEGSEAEQMLKYRTWRDGLASELTGLTVDELDDLDIDDKLKITSVIDDKLQADLGFMKR